MSEKGAIARCANSKASYTALSIFRTAFEKAIVVREEKKSAYAAHKKRIYFSNYANVFVSLFSAA